MDSAPVLFEAHDRVALITLNRPDSLNAINPPLGAALTEAMVRFRDDPELWVAILTGAGERAFCAGADLKWRAQNEEQARAQPGFILPGQLRDPAIFDEEDRTYLLYAVAGESGIAIAELVGR